MPKSALIVVDMQNDFVYPGGALYVPYAYTLPPLINALINGFRRAQQPVVFTRDWHPADHCSFIENGGQWPTHCIAETSGARINDFLPVPPGSTVIDKGTDPAAEQYSGFTPELRSILPRDTHLYICGVALDYCVMATYRDAVKCGYTAEIVLDATKAVSPTYDIKEALFGALSARAYQSNIGPGGTLTPHQLPVEWCLSTSITLTEDAANA